MPWNLGPGLQSTALLLWYESEVTVNLAGFPPAGAVHWFLTLTWWSLASDMYLPPPSTRFYVNLLCSEMPGSEAALHFNPRLDESSVVFNTLEQGTWGREERGSGIPFQHGQPFDVLLIATEEGFKVGPCHLQAGCVGGEGDHGVACWAGVSSVPLLPLVHLH